jgi:hypothetical protein
MRISFWSFAGDKTPEGIAAKPEFFAKQKMRLNF